MSLCKKSAMGVAVVLAVSMVSACHPWRPYHGHQTVIVIKEKRVYHADEREVHGHGHHR